jgi:hypothetical protein
MEVSWLKDAIYYFSEWIPFLTTLLLAIVLSFLRD